MFTFIFCKSVNDVRNLLLDLNDFFEDNGGKILIEGIRVQDDQTYFRFVLNQNKIIFIESDKSHNNHDLSPFIFPMKASIKDWESQAVSSNSRVFFQLQDEFGAEVNVIEAVDGTRIHFGFYPQQEIDNMFFIRYLLDYAKFVAGEKPKDILTSKEPIIEANIPVEETHSVEETVTVEDTISVEDRKEIRNSLTLSASSPKPTQSFDSWKPTYGRIIPTLHAYLYHNDGYHIISANTPKPIPFSNEFFEGFALFMVNCKTVPMSPKYTKRFENDKNCFEVQLQGRFKKVPAGPLFVGAEITKKMELGMFTKGICHSLLQFCQTFSPSIHSSFGDKQNIELPHITSPFWTTVDRLLITKKNEKPPSLFYPFPEPLEVRTARKKSKNYPVDVNTEDIFSFSLKTSYMDIERWNLVNIPLMKTMDLHTFWAEADLRFIAYAIDPAKTPVNSDGYPILHKQTDLQKVFALTIEHASNHPEWANNPNEEYEKVGANIQLDDDPNDSFSPQAFSSMEEEELEEEDDEDKENDATVNSDDEGREDDGDIDEFEDALNARMTMFGANDFKGLKIGNDNDEEEDEFFDTQNGFEETSTFFQEILQDIEKKRAEKEDIESLYGRKSAGDFQDNTDEEEEYRISRNTLIQPTSLPVLMKASLPKESLKADLSKLQEEINKVQRQHKSYLDKSTLVVAAIEVDDHRSARQGGRRVLYAFRRVYLEKDSSNKTQIRISNDVTLRSFNEWKQVFTVSKIPNDKKPLNFNKLTENEQRRLSLDYTYRAFLSNFADALNSFSDANLVSERNFMNSLLDFLSENIYNDNFLNYLSENESMVSLIKVQNKMNKYGKLSSQVGLRISNFAYSQEFIYYDENTNEIVFKNSLKRLGKKLVIPVGSVLWCKAYSGMNNINSNVNITLNYKKYLPINIPHSIIVIISTFSKNYLLIFHEKDPIFPQWMNLLNKASTQQPEMIFRMSNDSGMNSLMFNTIELIDDTSTMWNEKNDRMILNHRSFTQFMSYKLVFSNTTSNPLLEHLNDPVKYVAKLLEMILKISKIVQENSQTNEITPNLTPKSSFSMNPNNSTKDSNNANNRASTTLTILLTGTSSTSTFFNQLWIDFLDGIAYLQWIDLSYLWTSSSTSSIHQKELLSCFLNLYHCILLHGYLILGLPNTIFKWSSFFRNCCYQAFGEVFSLSELEHNIIKANMNRPGVNFIIKSFLPTTKYPFPLTIQDYRILFALNCGSVSNLPYIPIYQPDTLDAQLEIVTRLTLEQQITFINENTIMLPQICQWYLKDFEIDLSGNKLVGSNGTLSPKQLIHVLKTHLTGQLENQLSNAVQKKSINLKYSSFDYNCRLLSKF